MENEGWKIAAANEVDYIMEEAAKLNQGLTAYYRRKVPNKKPWLTRMTLDERTKLRRILSGNIQNNWYHLGEKLTLLFSGKVYGPDKHNMFLKSYCILHNDVKDAALICKNLEAQFFGKVKCFCIPYIERPWTDRPYTWIRVKVLFNN